MNWNIFRRNTTPNVTEQPDHSYAAPLLYSLSTSYSTSKALTLSAVYAAVEKISNAIAQLPVDVYQRDTGGNKLSLQGQDVYNLLNKRPNSRMTRFTMMKLLVTDMLLNGNGYLYINRKSGQVSELIYVPSSYVQIIEPKNLTDLPEYNVRFIGRVPAKDMIHILNFTADGIKGISTLENARRALSIASDAENTAQGFYRGGANISGVLKSSAPLTKKQKEDIKSAWTTAFNPVNGTPNSVALLEANLDFQPISINPRDAQLLDSRQFSVIEIARFFNISPVLLGDLTKSSYSTTEAANLAFLTETLQPLLQKFELEFERKLFTEDNIDLRFDTTQMLRADKSALSNYYNTMLYNGTLSINEVRKDLDLEPVEAGDEHMVGVNLMPLRNAINNKPADKKIETEDDDNRQ